MHRSYFKRPITRSYWKEFTKQGTGGLSSYLHAPLISFSLSSPLPPSSTSSLFRNRAAEFLLFRVYHKAFLYLSILALRIAQVWREPSNEALPNYLMFWTPELAEHPFEISSPSCILPTCSRSYIYNHWWSSNSERFVYVVIIVAFGETCTWEIFEIQL